MKTCSTVMALAIAVSSYSPAPPAQPSPRQEMPADVVGSPTQEAFDSLAWQLFVALNWPTPSGKVDRTLTIGHVATPRVWELYADPIDFFSEQQLVSG